MQRLLTTAKWDVDGAHDDIRTYVIDHLGATDGVLIGDDTGFEKKGAYSAGVQRQHDVGDVRGNGLLSDTSPRSTAPF